ncbi:indolepyruvate oxidoreductase subunit beta family protein [Hydrogenophaga sp.]|uniref:indolepyruvate oxidoreductase subunit beta family protein n=1 Tax=Hydrogenophaga sp. TaxID=1904254 RepID=UPI00262DA9C9|nr:indolepyruvate oxidoreductase subunit beta family protein [Hydrogenophaga sp.]MCW5654446.1 indolepyruvate oxidoreductase subunit beta family protein [Hydrogenophaga sp.]
MTPYDKSFGILIAALGGEGGGVLADWLVHCARQQGLPVQATSVPGVAQRTGATSYYIELLPEPLPPGSAAPVLGLTPVAGRVDVVVASELLEAARMVERGFVTERTTLLASTHRVYTTLEKMHMADGRQNPQRLADAARALARRAVLFDMEAVTVQHGTVVSAVMFGALAGAGTLPWPREVCETVIRASGKGVQASLAGFAAAFEQAREPTPARAPVAREAAQVLADAALPSEQRSAWERMLRPWPASVQLLAAHGALRCLDYQDARLADSFLAQVQGLVGASPADATQALDEAVRQLALWMCFEDVIRVADLKTRRSRFERVRREAQAQTTDVVRVTEHFKPGIDEVAAVLPRALGERLLALAQRRGWTGKAHVGLHIRSSSLWGYLMLRGLARLRPLRPRSLRHAQEHAAMAVWLDAMHQVLPRSPALALALAGLPQVLKGYGDTQLRGRENYQRLWATQVEPALRNDVPADEAAARLREALKTTLADPEGRLNQAHRDGGVKAQPVFWAAKPPRETPIPPAA